MKQGTSVQLMVLIRQSVIIVGEVVFIPDVKAALFCQVALHSSIGSAENVQFVIAYSIFIFFT